jgi:glycosyltransferase involved in cell wall biosynthesis
VTPGRSPGDTSGDRATPRVVIASRLFAPESGAAATRLRWLARAFADEGFAVQVLTSQPQPGSAPPDDDPGVMVSRWPVLRDANGIVRGYAQYLSFDVPLLLRLLLQRRRPDVVVCEPPPTTGLVVRLVCALRRVPYVYYAADVWSDGTASAGAPGAVVRLITIVESYVLRRARLVLSVSPAVTERLLRLGVDPERVQLVGNGVDVDMFRPLDDLAVAVGTGAEPALNERPPLDVPYAVYAGTMSEWQGADVFVRAFAKVMGLLPTDARLVFLGQGSDRPTVERLARDLAPDRVDVLGVVPPAEAARWLRHAECALVSVVPDQGYDFARPTKVWAATATGTPVVFAGRGVAAQEVADAGLGLVVDHEVDAVAQALVRAFDDQPAAAERRRLVDWTREHASLATIAVSAVAAIRAACDR